MEGVPQWVETTLEAQAMVIQHYKNMVSALEAKIADMRAAEKVDKDVDSGGYSSE